MAEQRDDCFATLPLSSRAQLKQKGVAVEAAPVAPASAGLRGGKARDFVAILHHEVYDRRRRFDFGELRLQVVLAQPADTLAVGIEVGVPAAVAGDDAHEYLGAKRGAALGYGRRLGVAYGDPHAEAEQ